VLVVGGRKGGLQRGVRAEPCIKGIGGKVSCWNLGKEKTETRRGLETSLISKAVKMRSGWEMASKELNRSSHNGEKNRREGRVPGREADREPWKSNLLSGWGNKETGN